MKSTKRIFPADRFLSGWYQIWQLECWILKLRRERLRKKHTHWLEPYISLWHSSVTKEGKRCNALVSMRHLHFYHEHYCLTHILCSFSFAKVVASKLPIWKKLKVRCHSNKPHWLLRTTLLLSNISNVFLQWGTALNPFGVFKPFLQMQHR